MADERDSTDPLGLGAKGGMVDDAADAVFGPGTQQEDGQSVGAADHEADRARSGADTGPRSPYELLTGDDEPPGTDDGEAVGASDREADIQRSR